MNEHIGFEDLVAFAWMNDLTEESIRLAARINSHLMNCAECMTRLESLRAVRRSADALKESRRASEAKIIRFPSSVEVAEFRAADYSAPELLEEGFIEASDDENSEKC